MPLLQSYKAGHCIQAVEPVKKNMTNNSQVAQEIKQLTSNAAAWPATVCSEPPARDSPQCRTTEDTYHQHSVI